MIDNHKAAKEYVYKEVSKRLKYPTNGEAYQWVLKQVAYYRNPTYMNTSYTSEVLKVLERLVQSTDAKEREEDKDSILMFICKL